SFSSESLRLREFAARSGLIHQWIDVETLPEPERLLQGLDVAPGDLPAVVAGDEVLRGATPGVLSSYLGLTLDAVPERSFDLVVVRLSDGTEVGGRALIIATGARYRRLPISNLAYYEGAGVYYSATETEALECTGSTVVVVGAGNSAGQAAMFLSGRAGKVVL